MGYFMPLLNIYKAKKSNSNTVIQTYYLGGLSITLRKNKSLRIAYNFGTTKKHDQTDIQPDEEYYDFFYKMIKLAR